MTDANKITTSREFLSPEKEFEWRKVDTLPDGAKECILYEDSDLGTYSRLLTFEPGFRGTKEPLVHDFDEVVYIVSGGAVNERLGCYYPAGSVAVFPAGVKHGPLHYPVGALVIEFRHYRK